MLVCAIRSWVRGQGYTEHASCICVCHVFVFAMLLRAPYAGNFHIWDRLGEHTCLRGPYVLACVVEVRQSVSHTPRRLEVGFIEPNLKTV